MVEIRMFIENDDGTEREVSGVVPLKRESCIDDVLTEDKFTVSFEDTTDEPIEPFTNVRVEMSWVENGVQVERSETFVTGGDSEIMTKKS